MVSGGNLITRNPAVHRPWSILANKTGCSDQSLSCLQQIPAQEIKRVVEENGLMFLPVFDSGMTVARNEMTSRKAIPMMIGSAFQDGLGAFPQNMDVESLINSIPLGASVRSQLVSSYKKGYTHGPGKEYTTPQYADAGFVTDLVFNCVSTAIFLLIHPQIPPFLQCLGLIMASPYQPATHVALNAAAKGNTLVYRYLYNATFDNLIWSYPPGVAHATEVPLVFGNLPPGSTPAQYALSNLMQTSWANFAKELNPGTGWVSILNSDGKANNEQDALNVLSVEAATRRQPVVERLMGNWGGAGRCYSLIDMTMGAVNLLPW
jgi:carboxylesterase type B